MRVRNRKLLKIIRLNIKNQLLACGLFMISIPAPSQSPADIYDSSLNSVSKHRFLGYEIISTGLNIETKPLRGKISVIIENIAANVPNVPFIIKKDSFELVFDGKFSFEINHKNLTVRQISLSALKKNKIYKYSGIGLLTGYFNLKKFIKQRSTARSDSTWVLQFNNNTKNPFHTVEVNKNNLFPVQFKYVEKNNMILAQLQFASNSDENNPEKPSTQMARYINTYSLLPIGDIGVPQNMDSRDTLIGTRAVDFNLTDFEGQKISLSDFSGRLVLLNFWESWCGPCRMSMQHLQELYNLYHSRGLEIIGITTYNLQTAKKLIKDKNITYSNAGGNEKLKKDYKIEEIPQYFLIDDKGKIIYASKNGFEEKLDELIKKKFADKEK